MTIDDELGALSPASAELMRMAEHALEGEDFRAALIAYDQVIASGSYGYVHAKRGFVRFELGDYDGAISDFDRAISLRPSSPTTLRFRAKAKESKGDLVGAMRDYQSSLAYSDRAETHCDIAMILEFQGFRTEALAEYEIAKSLDPESALAKSSIDRLSEGS